MNNNIEEVLDTCNQRIQHLTSSDLRAEALLKLIQVEYSNLKNPNLLQATQSGLVEMLDAMNKTELIQDYDFTIQLLTRYQESKSLDNVLPKNSYSKDLADRFMFIRSKIDKIINNAR